jgi:hypothetical protein
MAAEREAKSRGGGGGERSATEEAAKETLRRKLQMAATCRTGLAVAAAAVGTGIRQRNTGGQWGDGHGAGEGALKPRNDRVRWIVVKPMGRYVSH